MVGTARRSKIHGTEAVRLEGLGTACRSKIHGTEAVRLEGLGTARRSKIHGTEAVRLEGVGTARRAVRPRRVRRARRPATMHFQRQMTNRIPRSNWLPRHSLVHPRYPRGKY